MCIVTINNEDRLVVFGGKKIYISRIHNLLIDIKNVQNLFFHTILQLE